VFRKRLDELCIGGGVQVLAVDLHHVQVPEQVNDRAGRELVAEDLELEDPGQQHGDVADEEMALDGVLLLEEYRPCVEVGLHDAEGLLDPPEMMVGPVHGLVVHVQLAGHEHVEAGEPLGLLDGVLVDDGVGLGAVPADEADEPRAFAEHGAPVLRGAGAGRLQREPVDLHALFPRQLGVERHQPLLPDLVRDLLPAGLEGVGELVDAGLVCVQQLPLGIGDLLVAVLQEHPDFLGFGQGLHRLGEKVSVLAFPRQRDVFRAVQALVRHMDGAADHLVAPLQVPDDPPQDRLLRLVSGIQPEPDGDEVPVQQQAHADDRVRPALLARTFPAEAVLPVDLEVEVGAVEIGGPGVDAVGGLCLVQKKLGELLVVPAEEGAAVEHLVVGILALLEQARHDGVEGLPLARRPHRAGVDESAQQAVQVVLEVVGHAERIHQPPDVQPLHDCLQGEVAEVHRGGCLPDLGSVLLGAFAVHFPDLGPVEGDGVLHAAGLERLDGPKRLDGAVHGPFPVVVVVALVDGEVGAALESCLLEEVRHGSLRMYNTTNTMCIPWLKNIHKGKPR